MQDNYYIKERYTSSQSIEMMEIAHLKPSKFIFFMVDKITNKFGGTLIVTIKRRGALWRNTQLIKNHPHPNKMLSS